MIKIWDKKTPTPVGECTKTGRPPNRNRIWQKPADDSDPRSMAQFFKDMNAIITSNPQKHDGRMTTKAAI